MKTVLVDIDGTILHTSYPKGEFSWEKFENDMPVQKAVQPIISILDHLTLRRQYVIILFTARPEKFREHTEEVLEKHNVPYDTIYMAEEANTSDVEKKRKLVHRIKADGHQIEFAIDDRKEMVEMLRKEGILTLHVRHKKS